MQFLRRLAFQLILALLASTLSAKAAMQFDVFLGYDSLIPANSWFPVVIEVKNDGPTFTGIIQAGSSYGKQAQKRQAVVELPTGTLKRISIPMFSSGGYSDYWDVRLLDEHGKVRAESLNLAPKRRLTSGVPLMGALPRKSTSLPELGKIKNKDSALQPVAARLLPSTFPDNPIELDGLSSIYLNSEQASSLSAPQVEALLYWLNSGGHLILSVEENSDVTSSPWLRAIVPVEVKDIKAVTSHPELQDWLTHKADNERPSTLFHKKLKNQSQQESGNPYADLLLDSEFEHADLRVATGNLLKGNVVVSCSKTPLIVESDQGNGKVTMLLFSPERKPFSDWKNNPWFWSKISEVPSEVYLPNANEYDNGRWSSDGIIGAMIDSKQVRKLPVQWLLLLLLIYLAVIGPIDQYWLKKIKRPMLTWITFPCYVVAFSLLIYFIGYRLRAGESEWNELHVVDVLPRGQGAELKGHSYMSIYSPVNNEYAVENKQKFAAFRGEYQGSWSTGQESERAEITQNGDNFKARIFVPVWTSQLYVSDWWQSSDMPIIVSVTKQGTDWLIDVNNQQERALTNLSLFVANRVIDLGPLAAKQQKQFRQSEDSGMDIHAFLETKGGVLSQVISSRQNAFGTSGKSHISDDVFGTLKAYSFVSEMQVARFSSPPGLDLSGVVGNDRAVLLAYETDFSPIDPLNKFPARRSAKNTLWRISIPVTIK